MIGYTKKCKIIVLGMLFLFMLASLVVVRVLFVGAENTEKIKVACIGASITQGVGADHNQNYPTFLQELLGDGYEVGQGTLDGKKIYGFGYSGATLSPDGDKPYVQTQMYAESIAFAPDVLVVVLGTNDSKEVNRSNIDTLGNELVALVGSYQEVNPDVRVIVGTIPTAFIRSSTGINNDYIDRIVEIQKQTAVAQGWEIVDLNALTKNLGAYAPDGVHFNNAGYHLIAQEVANYVLGTTQNLARSASGEAFNWGVNTKDTFGIDEVETEYLTLNGSTALKVPLDPSQSITLDMSLAWDRVSLVSFGFSFLDSACAESTYDPENAGETQGLMFRFNDYAGIKMDLHHKAPTISAPAGTYYFQTKMPGESSPDGLTVAFGERFTFTLRKTGSSYMILINGTTLTSDAQTDLLQACGLNTVDICDENGYTYLNIGNMAPGNASGVTLYEIRNGSTIYTPSDLLAYGYEGDTPASAKTSAQLNAYVNGKYYSRLDPDYIRVDISADNSSAGMKMFGFSASKEGDGYYSYHQSNGLLIFLRATNGAHTFSLVKVTAPASSGGTSTFAEMRDSQGERLYFYSDIQNGEMFRMELKRDADGVLGLYFNGKMFVDSEGKNVITEYFDGGTFFTDADGYTYFDYGSQGGGQSVPTVVYQITDKTSIVAATEADILRISETVTLDDEEMVRVARHSWLMLNETERGYISIENAQERIATAEQVLVKKRAAVENVISKITSLPEMVTYADKAAIDEAKAAYDALTADERPFVTNEDTLQIVISALQVLQAQVDNITDRIAQLPAFADITLQDKGTVNLLASDLSQLSEPQQAAVESKELLEAAITKIFDLEKSAETDALIVAIPDAFTYEQIYLVEVAEQSYADLTDTQVSYLQNTEKLINAQTRKVQLISEKKVGDVIVQIEDLDEVIGLDDEIYVLAARAAYDALTETEKQSVTNYDALQAAEARIAELKEEEAESEQKIAEVIAKIEALNDDIGLDDEIYVLAARAAYDALTEIEKQSVTNYDALQAAEARIAELKENNQDETNGGFDAGSGCNAAAFVSFSGVAFVLTVVACLLIHSSRKKE